MSHQGAARGAGRAVSLYVVGDPYSRLSACKIGITRGLETRLAQIYVDVRRRTFLPDGMRLFSLYGLPDWQQAAELERALLRAFQEHKTDARTLGWLKLNPGTVDLAIDIMAMRLGLNCQKRDFSYVQWSHERSRHRMIRFQKR